MALIEHRGGNSPNARFAFDLSDGEGRAEIKRAGYWTLTRADGRRLEYPIGYSDQWDTPTVEEAGLRFHRQGMYRGNGPHDKLIPWE